ncbi:unnamed protein product [Cunninghamella blakesleeana]
MVVEQYNKTPVPIFIVMGVAGCGKTSVAEELQKLLGCDYVEGDSLHPKENVDKMTSGIPLQDDDRWSWLRKIRDTIKEHATTLYDQEEGKGGRALVVTCSSLKVVYRDILRDVPKELATVTFVYLKGTTELLKERIGARKSHFMSAAMLQSQLDTLQEPDPKTENVIIADIQPEPKIIASNVLKQL